MGALVVLISPRYEGRRNESHLQGLFHWRKKKPWLGEAQGKGRAGLKPET